MGVAYQRKSSCSLLIPETKNGQARTIPLTSKAAAIVRKLKGCPDGRLFANYDQRISIELAEAKAEGWNNRSKVSRSQARSDQSIFREPKVALISGHKDMRMLFRYAHQILKE